MRRILCTGFQQRDLVFFEIGSDDWANLKRKTSAKLSCGMGDDFCRERLRLRALAARRRWRVWGQAVNVSTMFMRKARPLANRKHAASAEGVSSANLTASIDNLGSGPSCHERSFFAFFAASR